MGVISNGLRDVKGVDILKNNFIKYFFFVVLLMGLVLYYDNEGKL